MLTLDHIRANNENADPQVMIIPATMITGQFTEDKKRRVAAYCRVSTDSDEQLNSYATQMEYYTTTINDNPDWVMAGIFADEGISGTSAKKRPAFMRMIDQCKKGKIDMVLTKSISRFARNTVDCLNYIRLLKQWRVVIVFEKEGIHSDTMESEMLVAIMSAFAQAESESLSENIKFGQRQNMKDGKVRYCYKNWLGYRRGENGKPVIVEQEAQIVLQIFGEYLQGATLRDIGKHMEQKKYVTPMGSKRWSISYIRSILQNEKYCGDVLSQKTFTADPISKRVVKNEGQLPKYLSQNAHPAIIDREVWKYTQSEMTRRGCLQKISDKTAEGSKYSGKYALTGLVICDTCGQPYRRCTWRNRDGSTRIVWRCANRLEHGKTVCGKSPTLDESHIHAAVLDAVNRLLPQREILLEKVQQNLRRALGGDAVEDSPQVLQNRLNDLEQQYMQVLQQVQTGASIETLTPMIATINEQIVTLRGRLEQMSADSEQEQLLDAKLKSAYSALGAWRFGLSEYNDMLTRQVVQAIRVSVDGEVQVRVKG